jgi:hypothetical protein
VDGSPLWRPYTSSESSRNGLSLKWQEQKRHIINVFIPFSMNLKF